MTIGPGVDLGGWDFGTPKANGLDEVKDEDILKVIKPAFGLTGSDAKKYVEENKPKLTHEQAERLGKKVAAYHMGRLIEDYETAPNNKDHVKFKDLPPSAQTVIFSAYYNYVPNFPNEAPKFWSHVTGQNWHKAYLELTDFRDSNSNRRKHEADYLYDGVLKGF